MISPSDAGTARHLRMVFVGWGAIARRVTQIVAGNDAIEIAAVAVRDRTAARPDMPPGSRLLSQPDELEKHGIELVVEAAGRAAVLPWGRAALSAGADYVVCSASAFTEDAVLSDLTTRAMAAGRQIIVPHGALAGIDGLAAATASGLDQVEHTISKPPAAWMGTEADSLVDLDRLNGRQIFFSGSAREAAARFPQNANAAVVTSLAGLGLDRTRVVLVADPSLTRNVHRIRASGAFGSLDSRIENEPLATNPKSSEMTPLGIARLLENRVSALVR